MNKSLKLEKLEKKFNVATKLIEDLDDISAEFESDVVTDIIPLPCNEIATTVQEDVFTITQLKQDFLMVRQNVMSLITKGQRILDQISILELSELKASQVEAMTNLQKVIGENLERMLNMYKMITEIEKVRQKTSPNEVGGAINMGSVTNNNIVFNGSPNDLLDILAKQKNE